jgi:hypothetical protein
VLNLLSEPFAFNFVTLRLLGLLCQVDGPNPELLDYLRFDCGFRKSAASARLFA